MFNFLLQIRHRFGCYDEITEVDRRRVRHCNWVRFLRAASTYSDEVNLIGTKVKGNHHEYLFSYVVFSNLEGRSAFKILTGIPTEKRPLGRPRRRWQDNIKMDLKEVGINTMNWAKDRDYWRALVNTELNF